MLSHDPLQKYALRCETALYLHFSNQREEQLEYVFSGCGAYVPLHEILLPQRGALSLCFWFEGVGSYLGNKVPLDDVAVFIGEFHKTADLQDSDRYSVRTALKNFTLVVERRGGLVSAYNLHRREGVNQDYDAIFCVPVCEYKKGVQEICQKYLSLVGKVKRHAVRYFEEKPQSDSVDGLVLRGRVDRKTPVVGETLSVALEIQNVSKVRKSLVNDFNVHVSGWDEKGSMCVSGNPLRGLKRPPLVLEPGESFHLTSEVLIERFPAVLRFEYSADNDFSRYTNMFPGAYLARIGKHFDLSECWAGELETEIALFVRDKGKNTTQQSGNDFEEWLGTNFKG